MSEVIVQTIKKDYISRIEAGIAYYRFITAINNINLSSRELQLLAFINYRGTISSSSAREEFCKMFGSSEATISNIVSKLSSLKLLVKDKSKTRINPALAMDFNKDLVIRLFININKNKEEEEVANGNN